MTIRRSRLQEIEHAVWHALDDCEVRAEEILIPIKHYRRLSRLLPIGHPQPPMKIPKPSPNQPRPYPKGYVRERANKGPDSYVPKTPKSGPKRSR